MLTTCREETASGGEAVGLKVERAIGGRWFEGGKVGLLDLKTADEEDLVLDASGLEKIAKLEMMDVDAGGDDLGLIAMCSTPRS